MKGKRLPPDRVVVAWIVALPIALTSPALLPPADGNVKSGDGPHFRA